MCLSTSGFERVFDEQPCSDIDECEPATLCSEVLEVCRNTVGSYLCECIHGYSRSTASGDCFDIDECSTSFNTGLCVPESEVCENEVGSFRCECAPGFSRPTDQ